jgi:hypothetical protein
LHPGFLQRAFMKWFLLLILTVIAKTNFAQQFSGFGAIDYRVQSIEPASPAELVHELTTPYASDIQKVRAIFSWIAEHIEYKTKHHVIQHAATLPHTLLKPIDSVSINSANDFVAESVLRNMSAVCEGYARLFKTLCDDAGIPSVLITGYARGDMNRIGTRFISNHYWNAVYVDSTWHLLDVTWASGYFTFYGSDFVKRFDDYYFFTSPELFIRDHFPDDLQWTLLPAPVAPDEFRNAPFKQRAFVKYNISSYKPAKGIIETAIGDTLIFNLQTSDPGSDSRKAADTASLDSSMMAKYSSVAFLQPEISGNKIRYSYLVIDANIEWLHLMYNNDVILRYKIQVKK